MKSRLLIAASLSVGLVAAAASAFAQDTSKQNTSKQGGEGNVVVARVDGSPIYLSDVVAIQRELPAQYREIPLATIFPHLVNELVDTRLAAAAAERDKLGDKPEVKKRLAFIRTRILAETYLHGRMDAEVTDENLRARYQAFLKTFPAEQELRARHILVPTEKEARDIIQELKKGGDFAELAKKKSKGPSATRGGDLGYFTRGRMVKPFSDAAFELKDGQITENPVKTQFGWHVIKVESRRKALPPSFEEKRGELEEAASREAINSIREKLRQNVKIETFDMNGAPTKP